MRAWHFERGAEAFLERAMLVHPAGRFEQRHLPPRAPDDAAEHRGDGDSAGGGHEPRRDRQQFVNDQREEKGGSAVKRAATEAVERAFETTTFGGALKGRFDDLEFAHSLLPSWLNWHRVRALASSILTVLDAIRYTFIGGVARQVSLQISRSILASGHEL